MAQFDGHSDRDRVREATDLVELIGEHVSLKPKGREHVGICPFHDDHSPSMSVVTHKGAAFYKCHACGAAGDAFTFIMDFHKMSFPEALRFLAQRAGIEMTNRVERPAQSAGSVDREALLDANTKAMSFFQRMLADDHHAHIRQIIAERGINDDIRQAFQVGYAPDSWDALTSNIERRNVDHRPFAEAGLIKPRKEGSGYYDAFRHRITFPILDELGRAIAFGARIINPEDSPKYLNSPESAVFAKSRTLYGIHAAKRDIIETGTAVITEGYTDVIACHQAGFRNVIGTLGTALTIEHTKVLQRICHTVVLVFDGDEAGQRAADRAVEVFFARPIDVKITILPDGCDPDDLLKTEGGREQFAHAIENGIDALSFLIDRFAAHLDTIESVSGRDEALKEFLTRLVSLGFKQLQGVRKQWAYDRLSEKLKLSIDTIDRVVSQIRGRPARASAAAMPTDVDHAPPSPFSGTDLLPRNRRTAERELIAHLINEPTRWDQAIAADGASIGLDELLERGWLQDDAAMAIARVMLQRGPEGCTADALLSDLESPAHRSTLSSLLVWLNEQRDAMEQNAEIDTPRDGLTEAGAALLEILARDQFNRDASTWRQSAEKGAELNSLASLIDQRRRQGYHPKALKRGIRA